MLFFKRKRKSIQDLFNSTFVDIHSHLLPGIDDGAKDLEDSIELISRLSALGISNFITTPHVLGDVYPNATETIQKKVAEVQAELIKRGMNHININAAAEYMLDEQFQERLKKKDLLTVKDNMILVEMSYFSAPINLFEILFEIQLKEYKPILAHPERYNFYHKDFEQYFKLKNAGCLFQLNLLSLTHHYGENVKKTTTKLLDNNLYDFVGTDTHHKNHIKLLDKIVESKRLEKVEQLIQRNAVFLKN